MVRVSAVIARVRVRQGQIQEFALGGPLTLPHSPSPFPLPQSGVLENF